jgi:periplasmic protein TonB
VKSSGAGLMRLVPLLIASLLLHLAFIIAVINSGRQESRLHHISTDMAVEYVAGDRKDEKRQDVVPLPGNLPPEPVRKIVPEAKTRAVPLPEGIPAAVGKVTLTAPVSGSPIAITTGVAANSGLRSGVVSGESPPGTDSGASTARQAATSVRAPDNITAASSAESSSLPRRAAYQALLKRLVEAHKVYPLAARKSHREGSCQRRFTLDCAGLIKHIETISSCGHVFLDEAATRAITSVGTFPPLPDAFGGVEEAFTITMTFTLARE